MKIQRMTYLFLLCLVAGTIAEGAAKRAGCELDPCEHQCVDTVDSYYCICFVNYVLQTDGVSCLHQNSEVLETIYQGCWADSEEARDLPYLIWERSGDASITQCVHDCNARGFDFAGLQRGTDCWCGNSYQRAYEESTDCTSPCPGSQAQICGGILASSIYKINRDERYMGCYTENVNDPDLPNMQWAPDAARSVDDCIAACSSQNFDFAGVFNGGQCSCGTTYGKHGSAGEELCDISCYEGYSGSNCGGEAANAIYRVIRGINLGSNNGLALHKVDGRKATLQLSDLYVYPHTLGLFSERVLFYASDIVNTIFEDRACTNADCYSSCGDMSVPPGLDQATSDVIIRQFHIHLSQLGSIVSPEGTERVYVFAQTFYIDSSVDYPWSLYVRARQVIINYAADPSITFDQTGPVFDVDINAAVINGLPSDLAFQKQSLLCAQKLISSSEETDHRLGWNILDDMARDTAYSIEQEHFLNGVRAMRVHFTSLGRSNIHWAPYFPQNYYVSTLTSYHNDISLYYSTFTQLLDSISDCQSFITSAIELVNLWSTSIVYEAAALFSIVSNIVQTSEEVYPRITAELQLSIDELLLAGDSFEQGINQIAEEDMRTAMLGLIATVNKMVAGDYPSGAQQVQADIQIATDDALLLEGFHVNMEALTKSIEQIILFNTMTDAIISSGDFARYIDIIEHVAGLSTSIPIWTTLRNQIDEIFAYPDIAAISGALDYHFACISLINWEEANHRAFVEYATNLRLFAAASVSMDGKQEMQQRYEQYVSEVQQDCSKTTDTAIRFAEQNYDVMLELNRKLVEFCQAYHYEEMDPCPTEATPDFSASIPDLLDAIDVATTEADDLVRTSPTVIQVLVVDEPDAPENCVDVKVCPLKMFKETKVLYYDIPTDHSRFVGLNVFLVDELEVYLPGAFFPDNSMTSARVQITTSGPFQSTRSTDVSTYISRPLSTLLFQYDLETDAIELSASLLEQKNSAILHSTPFTTWLFTLPETGGFNTLDISQVESVNLMFHGTFDQLPN